MVTWVEDTEARPAWEILRKFSFKKNCSTNGGSFLPTRGWPLYSYDETPATTVDGSETQRALVEVGSLSHYLHGFLDPGWCRISSINLVSIKGGR